MNKPEEVKHHPNCTGHRDNAFGCRVDAPTNKETTPENWDEIRNCIEVAPHERYGNVDTWELDKAIKNLLATATAEARRNAIEEMITLSDTIEVRFDVSSTDEWRAFKAFRNTMRDTLEDARHSKGE